MADEAAVAAEPAFVQNGWTWASTSPKTPSRAAIAEEVLYLLRRLPDGEETFVSTGRLRVQRDGDGEVGVLLELVSSYEFELDGSRPE